MHRRQAFGRGEASSRLSFAVLRRRLQHWKKEDVLATGMLRQHEWQGWVEWQVWGYFLEGALWGSRLRAKAEIWITEIWLRIASRKVK